nr:hypothetical protein [Tanacetum cinerariifolium]
MEKRIERNEEMIRDYAATLERLEMKTSYVNTIITEIQKGRQVMYESEYDHVCERGVVKKIKMVEAYDGGVVEDMMDIEVKDTEKLELLLASSPPLQKEELSLEEILFNYIKK